MRHSLKRRSVAIAISCALILFLSTIAPSLAFADTYIATYDGTGVDPSYGPYLGYIYADNLLPYGSTQTLQAQNWGMMWSASNVSSMQYVWAAVGPVFHVLDYPGGGCSTPFAWDGAWDSNMPGASPVGKNSCSALGNGFQNEVRVMTDTGNIAPDTRYYGQAEFTVQNGDLYYAATGKVANDIYFQLDYNEQKDNLPTWCFNGDGYPDATSGPAYGC